MADSLDAGLTGVGELKELSEIGCLVNAVVGADDREKIGGLGGRDPVKELVLQDVTGFKHHAHPLVETVVVRTASMGLAQMRRYDYPRMANPHD
jgi:hypothetical protein